MCWRQPNRSVTPARSCPASPNPVLPDRSHRDRRDSASYRSLRHPLVAVGGFANPHNNPPLQHKQRPLVPINLSPSVAWPPQRDCTVLGETFIPTEGNGAKIGRAETTAPQNSSLRNQLRAFCLRQAADYGTELPG